MACYISYIFYTLNVFKGESRWESPVSLKLKHPFALQIDSCNTCGLRNTHTHSLEHLISRTHFLFLNKLLHI